MSCCTIERIQLGRVQIWIAKAILAPDPRPDQADASRAENEPMRAWLLCRLTTVGPYNNRQETYAYFSLPFCRGPKESIGHYHETMGESLLGVELDFSGLDIKFRTNVKKTVFCKMKLTNEAYQTFVYAIKNSYFYQMYLDDMPIW
ncbi:hypothetical protein COOONC_24904, partial [Cooperia oncophora]